MNGRSTEGEGACWEGVEMTTSPDQFVYDVLQHAGSLYTCWYTFSVRLYNPSEHQIDDGWRQDRVTN